MVIILTIATLQFVHGQCTHWPCACLEVLFLLFPLQFYNPIQSPVFLDHPSIFEPPPSLHVSAGTFLKS